MFFFFWFRTAWLVNLWCERGTNSNSMGAFSFGFSSVDCEIYMLDEIEVVIHICNKEIFLLLL